MQRKKKLYFDNEKVTEALLEYNRLFDEEGIDKIELMHPYTDQIQQLVRGVINTHKIYRWWPDLDELIQEGLVAIYASFRRYDPDKGTAFNYLSIVAKQHLKNWTQQRNKKNFVTAEFNEELYKKEVSSGLSDALVLKYMFLEVEVPDALERTLEAIAGAISQEKIFNKRDVIKHLSRKGFDKPSINNVFEILEDHFGDLNE